MDTILFLNHKEKQCGVYQYGLRTGDILKKSSRYNFIYQEVDSEAEHASIIANLNPRGIIYNYHPATMPWLGNHCMDKFPNIVHYGIHHEGTEPNIKFNGGIIILDTTFIDTEDHFSVPRPLFENINITPPITAIPVISSFGFGFMNKGFNRICRLVNAQFDSAIIKLHIPFAFFGDRDGASVRNIYPGCYSEIRKPNIKLVITNNFLTDSELLNFLGSSTINVFLYDEMIGRGLSSVIDYALSVNVPIAISKTNMFRHINTTSPSICVEDRSLPSIIQSGSGVLQQYRDKWSNYNLISKYEQIIERLIK